MIGGAVSLTVTIPFPCGIQKHVLLREFNYLDFWEDVILGGRPMSLSLVKLEKMLTKIQVDFDQ